MGVSDYSAACESLGGVPQEIVLVCSDSSPDAVTEIQQFLAQRVSKWRIYFRWDTWKGVYITPPDDAIPWCWEEYDQLCEILEYAACPHVMMVDRSDGSGSMG